MEVLSTRWISSSKMIPSIDGSNITPCIGIIKARDIMTDEIKYYIGVGDGKSETSDTAYILAYGTKMTGEEFTNYFLSI